MKVVEVFRSLQRGAFRLLRRPSIEMDPPIQVRVFIAQNTGADQHQLLIFPQWIEAEVPEHLRHLNWRHLASTDLRDKLLATAAPVVQAEFARQDYSLLTLTR